MKITLTRSAVVLFSVVVGSMLANSRWSVAQEDAAPDVVESTQNPPAAPPAPVFDESREPGEELGYQALMQGPVHEAFAAPIDSDLADGVRVLDKAPPNAVDEQAPEDRPEDDGFKWIPGYWAWNDDAGDYVWVSGLWRRIPPGRTWIPGSWSETKSGHHRWTSGYWAVEGTSADNANYLPLPPKSIDNGPSVSAPSDDSFWVPGQWIYADGDYQWRSGFWSESQTDLVWQPACYVYTPQGYVLVDGYWDYLPPDRGQLYAPIEFYDPVYLRPNYVYRPRYPLVDTASLLLSLFFRRGYPHYYYGNFYGSRYFGLGYRPWYDIGFGRGHVAPWLNHYDRKYRKSGINFVGSMQRYEDHARKNHQRTRYVSGKRSVSGDVSTGPSGKLAATRGRRSLDDIVRSDIARTPIDRKDRPSSRKSDRKFGGPSSDFSRSSVSSGRQDQFRNSSSDRTTPSGAGRSDSFRSNNSGQFSTSRDRSGTSSGLQSGIGFNQNSRSRGSRSIGTSPSSSFRSFGSSPRGQRGPSPSIQSSPSTSSSLRSRGATQSFQRGPSASFSTGRRSSGFSSRSNIAGSNRGGGGGGSRVMSSRGGSGRSSFSGGSGRSGFRGGGGRKGGGGRSGGSKGRGRGKK